MTATPARSRFITFEGGEGAGKSTQAKRLAAKLETAGHAVTLTREPGGSPGAEEIRSLLVTGGAGRWTPQSEALLLYAARHDHLERVIRPALRSGSFVISDRFSDSSMAYQGHAGGVDAAFLDALEREVVGNTKPGLTLILDLPAETGLARAGSRKGSDGETRFEAKGLAFHESLRRGFLEIAAAEPGRCKIIDATGDVEAVEAAVWTTVAAAYDLGAEDRQTPKAGGA